MTDQKITVTIADDHVSQAADVADQLRAAGMNVEQVLGAAGVITGSLAGARRQSIEALPGVAAVEDETSFQIAPPDAEVQ
jgi:hypothetical protein